MHTIVSAMPFAFHENKAGQVPPTYSIPPAIDDIQVLHVDTATFGIYIGNDRTLAQIIPSSEVARGLIEDFCTAQLAFVPEQAKPALFAVEGKFSADEIKQKFSKELAVAKSMQTAWFVKLAKLADDAWQKFRRHTAITDYQIYAGKALGLDREWLLTEADMQDCPSCATRVRQNIALCPQCRCILNEEKARSLKFAVPGKAV